MRNMLSHVRNDVCIRSGVNFTNVLRTAFAPVDPKSVKRYWLLDWIFTLLGATGVKAVLRTLMKLSPGVNFINVERTSLSYQCMFWQLFLVICTLRVRGKSCRNDIRTKNLCVKMLMKLTEGVSINTFWLVNKLVGKHVTKRRQVSYCHIFEAYEPEM